MECSKKLKFSPLAWAKIQWMMTRAGKLEMSGFGVSAPDEPFSIVDFQTIKQECTGTETDMDDLDLSQYLERMAKAGVPPNRCVRVWIHSHPFATTKPSPSGTDVTTLEEKTGADSAWAIMVIVGQGPTFARLHIRPELLDHEAIELDMECEVDWALLATDKILKDWRKEFKLNIHEAPPAPPAVVISNKKNRRYRQQSFVRTTENPIVTSISDKKLLREWGSFDQKGHPDWLAAPGEMEFQDYMAARREGFTPEEIGYWGDLVMNLPKESLRLSRQGIEKAAAAELAEIRLRNKP